MANAERLRAMMDRIREEHNVGRFDMYSWIGTIPEAERIGEPLNVCHTTLCAAGHAAVLAGAEVRIGNDRLFGPTPGLYFNGEELETDAGDPAHGEKEDVNPRSVFEFARAWLDLSILQAYSIFYATAINNPDHLEEHIKNVLQHDF